MLATRSMSALKPAILKSGSIKAKQGSLCETYNYAMP